MRLIVPSPGPRPNQPPRINELGGDVDVEGVARSGIKKSIDPLRHVRNRVERRDQAGRRGDSESEHPDESHAGHIKQRAPNQRDEHGLAEIRLQHQKCNYDDKQHQRDGVGRHIGALAGFAKQPRDQDHEGGFQKLRRLNVHAENHQPTAGAFNFGTEIWRGSNEDEADKEDNERKLADFPR